MFSGSPGVVDTEIAQTNDFRLDMKLYQKFITTWPMAMLDSEDVAYSVIYALSTPPHVQVHELIIKPVGEKD